MLEKDQYMVKGTVVKKVPNHSHERHENSEPSNVCGRLVEKVLKDQHREQEQNPLKKNRMAKSI